jgi:anti-anti-sigma regulatory factor
VEGFAMTSTSGTRVGRDTLGYCIRVEGRGTLRESPGAHAFTRHALDNETGVLTIDLEDCEYLDSTFLGCLVDLHRRYGRQEPPRFLVAASPEARMRLLAPTCLETLFHYREGTRAVLGECLPLPAMALTREDLGHHVLECHRRLVEQGSPDRAALQSVVERLAHELVVR